jgi:hypothetical protein
MSAAMLPPAPPLFSITTDWPQISCNRLPTSRAVMSVDPPGVNGTTMRTGLAGQLSPSAREGRMAGAAAAAASAKKRRRSSMGAVPLQSDRPIASGRCRWDASVKRGTCEIKATIAAGQSLLPLPSGTYSAFSSSSSRPGTT